MPHVTRAYKTRSEDGLEVLDLEFETKASKEIDKRLLVYHAILLEKYDLPVTSILIYPFVYAENRVVHWELADRALRLDIRA